MLNNFPIALKRMSLKNDILEIDYYRIDAVDMQEHSVTYDLQIHSLPEGTFERMADILNKIKMHFIVITKHWSMQQLLSYWNDHGTEIHPAVLEREKPKWPKYEISQISQIRISEISLDESQDYVKLKAICFISDWVYPISLPQITLNYPNDIKNGIGYPAFEMLRGDLIELEAVLMTIITGAITKIRVQLSLFDDLLFDNLRAVHEKVEV